MAANNQAYPYQQLIKDQSTGLALRAHWDAISALQSAVKGPVQGTLNPDQKPGNLSTTDAGTLFYATDFDRTFQWNGTAWQDAPGAPQRGQTAPFLNGLAPSVGWALCNGSQVVASTSNGNTQLIQTPQINDAGTYGLGTTGLQVWVRL